MLLHNGGEESANRELETGGKTARKLNTAVVYSALWKRVATGGEIEPTFSHGIVETGEWSLDSPAMQAPRTTCVTGTHKPYRTD